MAVEQGKYGLWYSKGTGFATKEQAQAHENGTYRHAIQATSAGVKKAPVFWLAIIAATVILVSVVLIAGKSISNSTSPSKVASDDAALNEIKYQRMTRELLLPYLKDPESAQFRNQTGFCGEVNAKNSFGGYSGFKRFIAGGKDMVFLEDDQRLEAGAFQAAWSQFCV